MRMSWMLCVCVMGGLNVAAVGSGPASRPAFQPMETDVVLPPDFFPILPWGPMHGWQEPGADYRNGVASMAECNFTLAGFAQPRDLPECERLGLMAIMAPPGGPSPFAKRDRVFTDEEVDTYVKRAVEEAGDSKAILGYYIVDEPGTRQFPGLARAVAAVRKYAPGKLAYINLFPGYATIGAPDTSQLGAASFTEYLERFVAEVKPQLLSYDNYKVQQSDDLQNASAAAGYYSDLLEVRRVALKHRLPFWNIVSSNQIRPNTPPPSPANMLFQAYTTLAAGGRGVSWYTYYGGGYGYGPVDKTDHRTESWDYLRMVNAQVRTLGPLMNRLYSTGVYFAAPLPVEGLPTLPGRIVKDVQARTSMKVQNPRPMPVMVGEFVSEAGEDWLMIVNLSLQHSINIAPALQSDAATLEIISAVDARPVPYDVKLGHWLVAGQGVLMRVR